MHDGDQVADFSFDALTRLGREVVAEGDLSAIANRALNVRSVEKSVVEDDAKLTTLVATGTGLIAFGEALHILGAFGTHRENDFRLTH